jgi:hypothetical protein
MATIVKSQLISNVQPTVERQVINGYLVELKSGVSKADFLKVAKKIFDYKGSLAVPVSFKELLSLNNDNPADTAEMIYAASFLEYDAGKRLFSKEIINEEFFIKQTIPFVPEIEKTVTLAQEILDKLETSESETSESETSE